MNSKTSRAWIHFVLLALMVVGLIGLKLYQNRQEKKASDSRNEEKYKGRFDTATTDIFGDKNAVKNNAIPEYVYKTFEYISKNNQAPNGFIGGRIFSNREKRLIQFDDYNRRIKYREWDVHPKVSGKSRGAERLITGSDSSAYYTKDHYKTFIKIRKDL